jgi:hypothetical protein
MANLTSVTFSSGTQSATGSVSTIDALLNLTTALAVTPTVTAGAYATNNALGGVMTFTNIIPAVAPGFNGILQSIKATFRGTTVGVPLYVAVFKTTPTGTYADHATPTWNISDAAALLGVYPLPSPQSLAGLTMTIYNLDGIGKAFTGTSANLYAVVIAGGAFTPATSADFALELAVLPG